jgi:hypothetical protein
VVAIHRPRQQTISHARKHLATERLLPGSYGSGIPLHGLEEFALKRAAIAVFSDKEAWMWELVTKWMEV